MKVIRQPRHRSKSPKTAGIQFLILCGTGNPTALIASGNYVTTAYSYDPYGVATITKDTGGNGTDQNPYTFKNGIQDRTTGWIKYGARYYQPTTGRWTQQATLDNPLDPNNANRYAYAANNPLNYADPIGLVSSACIGGAGALGVGLSYAVYLGAAASSIAAGDALEGVSAGAATPFVVGALAAALGGIFAGIAGSDSC